MAFRKRNVVLGRPPSETTPVKESALGVKPSSLSSHTVTSTGTPSLDALLGGHGGLILGSSLLVEESGTTDFSGALLRYYAAQGICHGHTVHIVGVGEHWVRELPGVLEEKHAGRKEVAASESERMKIAWRYENVGVVGERAPPSRIMPSPGRENDTPFQHSFDLSKRLSIPSDAQIHHLALTPTSTPFESVIRHLERSLKTSAPNAIHRLVIPTTLSPAIYPPHASRPENFICFLHSLRALLLQHSDKLTAMITLPLELYPRTSGLIRWAEHLCDGVLELTPFPHLMDASNSLAESGGARSNEDQPQGLVHVHKLPVLTEQGEGGAGGENSIGDDLAFTVSRRKFAIKPFSLPPLEGDQDAQKDAGKLTGKDVEF